MLKNKTILLFTTFRSVTPSSSNKDCRFSTVSKKRQSLLPEDGVTSKRCKQ
jgi:hypothetical protein